jgi:hypothetical protein
VIKPALIPIEGPEKAIRGGVNESQSKFLDGTQHISPTEPDAPLFYLAQDCTAIAKLSALGTGLGTATETRDGTGKDPSETVMKIGSKMIYILTVFH